MELTEQIKLAVEEGNRIEFRMDDFRKEIMTITRTRFSGEQLQKRACAVDFLSDAVKGMGLDCILADCVYELRK